MSFFIEIFYCFVFIYTFNDTEKKDLTVNFVQFLKKNYLYLFLFTIRIEKIKYYTKRPKIYLLTPFFGEIETEHLIKIFKM